MPTYEFSFPASAAGLPVSITQNGTEVTTTTVGTASSLWGKAVATAVLAAGTYVGEATNARIFYSSRAVGVVTDAVLSGTELTAAYAGRSTVIPKWTASTAYALNAQVLSPLGDSVYCTVAHTSGSTFDWENWDSTGTYLPTQVVGIAASLPGAVVGNSWIASSTNGLYAQRVLIALGVANDSTNLANLATSGYRMQDTAKTMVAAGAKTWPTARAGMLIIGDLLNNLIETDSAANRAAALSGLRTAVALASASSRIEQTDARFAYTGAWTQANTQSYASGGTVATVSTDAAYADITVPGGTSYLLFHGTNGTSLRGGQVTVSSGGVTIEVIDLNDRMVNTPFTTNGISPVVVRLANRTNGDVIRVLHNTLGRTAPTFTFLDALLPQSTTAPVILIQKPIPVTASTHNTQPALLTYLRTLPDLVAAEFGGNVMVFDPLPGWDTSRMLKVDGLHPNEIGARHIRDTALRALDARLYRGASGLALA